MAVLTPMNDHDARELLAHYGLGPPRAVVGLTAGSVNSNFAIDLDGRRLFLRVYEERDRRGAVSETAMVERLAGSGVPTPAPLRRIDGGLVSDMRGKPAALFPWRPGAMRCQASVTVDDVSQLGEALARVHVAGATEVRDESRFRFEDLDARLDRIAASGDARFAPMIPTLRDALATAHAARDAGLPRGLIHGDLFRDNVLWEGPRLAALLDFESASDGTFAYDLMVTALAWCVGDDLDVRLARALREGYEHVRPLTLPEREALASEGAFAALRFAVTRITDFEMRAPPGGPPPAKNWRRFMMRFDKLRSLGSVGLRDVLGD